MVSLCYSQARISFVSESFEGQIRLKRHCIEVSVTVRDTRVCMQ